MRDKKIDIVKGSGIVSLHFLCFKTISDIEVKIYDMPRYMIASFPVLFRGGVWWVLYSFVGITCPLICQHLFMVCIKKVRCLIKQKVVSTN